MNRIQELVQIYMGMRAQGMDAKRALQVLRPQIDMMSQVDQVELVRQVRHLEAQDDEIQKTGTQPKPGSKSKLDVQSKPIKSLNPTLPKLDREQLAQAQKLRDENKTLTQPTLAVPTPAAPVHCPHCGRPNRAGEIWCTACGKMLQESESSASTRELEHESGDDSQFFGKASVLVLTVRDKGMRFKVRPQKQKHDIIIGRGDQSVQPDVDLDEVDAANYGVSRMHASLHYDARLSTLSVTDMSTVNGTYLNGVKLLPGEVRVLQDGDELRLGQMVLNIQFYVIET